MRMYMSRAFTHLFQKSHMRGYSGTYPFVFYVLNAVFLAGFLNDLADSRIMYMRYFGKQMVFYLEIQSTNQPTYQFIPGGKIGRCFQLVNSPFIFHFASSIIW